MGMRGVGGGSQLCESFRLPLEERVAWGVWRRVISMWTLQIANRGRAGTNLSPLELCFHQRQRLTSRKDGFSVLNVEEAQC